MDILKTLGFYSKTQVHKSRMRRDILEQLINTRPQDWVSMQVQVHAVVVVVGWLWPRKLLGTQSAMFQWESASMCFSQWS